MVRILIVEDDEDKRGKIVVLVTKHFAEFEIIEARSFQSGLRAVEEDNPDLVILDMTMRNFDKSPTEDGGRPHPFAGREILRQMKRERKMIPTIIITQFEEFGDDQNKVTLPQLTSELEQRFPNYRGTIEYRHHIDAWQSELKVRIESIVRELI
ncbi:MAG: response regulator [Methylocystis sp.]|nr:MAG: response regulator [Methylocystis sp.]